MSSTELCSIFSELSNQSASAVSPLTIVGVTGFAIAVAGWASAQRSESIFQYNITKSHRLEKLAKFFFLISFFPLGVLLSAIFDIETIWTTIFGGGIFILAVIGIAVFVWKLINNDMSEFKDRVLYCLLGFLGGIAFGAIAKSLCLLPT